MKRGLILGAGRGPRLSVLEIIRGVPGGLGVGEIAKRLGMSYMGVKAHCVALTKAGHLETRRSPSSKGRPLLLYRLTERGEEMFRGPRQRLATGLLREAGLLFGAAAPQKILLKYYRAEALRYRESVGEGALSERLSAFVRLRVSEGREATLEEGPEGWILRESLDPEAEVVEQFPVVAGYQELLVGEVLGVPVERLNEGSTLLYRPRSL
jgi:predicted ArsR family transcriptional regulator